MLIDERNRFLSQREIPKLTLFKLTQHNNGFTINAQNKKNSTFDLPFQIASGELIQVNIWDDACSAIEYREGSKWFSEHLKSKCKLVYMPDTSNRFVDKKYAANNEIVSFSDGYPLLLIGQESLDDLNSKLKTPIGMERFRPNLVTSGSKAFEADSWQIIKINSIEIKVTKPCARCTIPSINPATGELEKEPLATLNRFRKRENKIYFGQNLLHKNEGSISCGAEVIVIDTVLKNFQI